MEEIKIINVSKSLFSENDRIAAGTRRMLRENRTFMINLMASPGAGKTSVLLRTVELLKERCQIGVMEADIAETVDARKMAAAGIPVIQVHTGGQCAMDAAMTRQALEHFKTGEFDLLVLENVGNLVCPAESDTGASKNVMILSIPEGDDKPLKYPLMFQVCEVVLVNKTDTREFFSFDDDAFRKQVHDCNPDAKIFFLSAKTGEGFFPWIEWLNTEIAFSHKLCLY
jgi:hydrogenase nickel incorporation protein HypB